MRNSYLFDSVLYYVCDSLVYLVLGKRSSVELHNRIVHRNTGLFTDKPSHLRRIIIFDRDLSPGLTESLLDKACWEGIDVSPLQKVCFYPVTLEVLHSVEYRALRCSPADKRNRSRLGPVQNRLL